MCVYKKKVVSYYLLFSIYVNPATGGDVHTGSYTVAGVSAPSAGAGVATGSATGAAGVCVSSVPTAGVGVVVSSIAHMVMYKE
jgi:hypothetical protein